MFEQLGGWDPCYPAGWEDVDLCWRARLQGWRTVFVPQAVCWHKVGVASHKAGGEWVRYRGSLGGRLYFAAKLLPFELATATWGLALGALVRDTAARQWSDARRRAALLREVLGLLPTALAERRRLYAQARRTPRQHLRALAAI